MAIDIDNYRVGLDTKDPLATLNFVSHAHSDHTSAVRKNSLILCSQITKELVEVRSKYSLNVVEKLNGAQMLNSGHMLGSKQLHIKSEKLGSTITYTGDYQMQKSFAAEPIEIEHSDILMMDSTYPYANIFFDAREEVTSSMQSYVRYKERMGCVVFGAYSMGKAQELIGIFNEVGLEPVVDEKIARMNEVYNRHGFKLRAQEAADLSKHFDSSVMIVSMHKLDSVKMMASYEGKKVFSAVASGFAKMQKFNTDVQFALSDHADFSQALEYVASAQPKIIYTYGSNSAVMAKNLKANGYNALPFNVKSDIVKYQLSLL